MTDPSTDRKPQVQSSDPSTDLAQRNEALYRAGADARAASIVAFLRRRADHCCRRSHEESDDSVFGERYWGAFSELTSIADEIEKSVDLELG